MFDPAKIYWTDDAELLRLGRPSTLAHWRCEGKGPAFVKLGGKRIGYRGAALNKWLDEQTVSPGRPAVHQPETRVAATG